MIPDRKGMRSHFSCAFNLPAALDDLHVAQVTGSIRFSPRVSASQISQPTYARDVALAMKLNLLRSNKF
jgi:hypothetical protein